MRRLVSVLLGLLLVGCGGQPQAAHSAAPKCATPPAGVRAFLIAPGQSTAQYTAREKITLPAIRALLRIVGDDNTAVGKTQQMSGEIDLGDGLRTAAVHVTADLRTLDSGVGLRDQRIRGEFLESNRYPKAVFAASGITLGSGAIAEGTPMTFTAPGTMTVRDITKPFVFNVTATLTEGTITGTASGRLNMSDFGFAPPAIAGAIQVEEGLDIKVEIVATETRCL
jgi:polyisoprenoid-binding protein YceI